jgi:toxin ParE1/3/4
MVGSTPHPPPRVRVLPLPLGSRSLRRKSLLRGSHRVGRVASLEIADNMLRGIERASEAIARNPLARRTRDDLMPGLRSALVSPHTIFFRIQGANIEIVRVLHGRRDFPALFGRRANPRPEGSL